MTPACPARFQFAPYPALRTKEPGWLRYADNDKTPPAERPVQYAAGFRLGCAALAQAGRARFVLREALNGLDGSATEQDDLPNVLRIATDSDGVSVTFTDTAVPDETVLNSCLHELKVNYAERSRPLKPGIGQVNNDAKLIAKHPDDLPSMREAATTIKCYAWMGIRLHELMQPTSIVGNAAAGKPFAQFDQFLRRRAESERDVADSRRDRGKPVGTA
jgi:hypothetical protein